MSPRTGRISNSAAALTRYPMPAARSSTRRRTARGQTDSARPANSPRNQHRLRFERNIALGLRQDAYRRIGVGGVPAGELRVVIQLDRSSPSRESHRRIRGSCRAPTGTCRGSDISAQDAVGVEDADLDVLDAALGQKVAEVADPASRMGTLLSVDLRLYETGGSIRFELTIPSAAPRGSCSRTCGPDRGRGRPGSSSSRR